MGVQENVIYSTKVSNAEAAARRYISKHLFAKSETTGYEAPRFAVKRLSHHLLGNPDLFEQAAIDLVNEAHLLMAMDHSNIIGIRGWSCDGPGAYKSGMYESYFIVLDFMDDTLPYRINAWRRRLTKYRLRRNMFWSRCKYEAKVKQLLTERLQAARDISLAVQYMHERRIIYRDIKSANIGFDSRGVLKLFDFGLSRVLPDESQRKVCGGFDLSCVGTNVYMAPEVRRREPYDLSADLYAYGVLLWEIMALATPNDKMMQHRRLIEEDNSTDIWLPICSCWSDSLQHILKRTLSANATSRPCINEVRSNLENELAHSSFCPHPQKQRRRSTFRLDLTYSQILQESSIHSSTSHLTSIGDERSRSISRLLVEGQDQLSQGCQ